MDKNNFGYLRGKQILVMGLGLHGGGVGTVRFLARAGAKITVTDLRSRHELPPSLKALAKYRGIRYVLGRHRKKDFLAADIVVKNPGVLPRSIYLALARKHGAIITSDIGIFFRHCPATVIGVTGTRGKSTTAYLIGKFLKKKYKKVYVGGNIRKSALEFLPSLRPGDIVVLELSSFQLQDLEAEKKSPAIAVITNILRDHLNWHKSMREYILAKSVIFKFQDPSDYLFLNPDDATLRRLARAAPSRVVYSRLPPALKTITDRNLGAHYGSSVALAVAVARHLHIPLDVIKNELREFRGLPERQHEIRVKNGVHFVDDTTATTPDAAIAAIQRFRKLAGIHQLILIAGGSDKNLNFRNMIRKIRRDVDLLILLPGTATEKLKKGLGARNQRFGKAIEIQSMKEAAAFARRIAAKGDYVVLSPGAASFGLFLNEFDRGKQFKEAIDNL